MSIWKQASAMAAQTPPQRNRYADFLRAMSILFVIVGHWLVAAVFVLPESGAVQVADLQQLRPGTQWISWLFQVMPVFFMVGGYANALSIRSSQAKGIVYAEWLYARLARLMRPLLLLMVTWLVLAFLMRAFDAELETVRYVSQGALVPTWFLAIYTLIVMLAPWSYRLWLQFGYRSWLVFVALSLTVDALYFLQQWHWLGWSNYLWIWLAVHPLG
ncbi:acyltransferase family protein, partial [bacterium]|nr:acyltransferase family protein [bacterium]